MPVIDCIATDNNTNLFEYESPRETSIQRTLPTGSIDFEQDILKNYRNDVNIFFTTNNHVNNPQLYGSILTVDSDVTTENITCLNEIRENKFKDLQREAKSKGKTGGKVEHEDQSQAK